MASAISIAKRRMLKRTLLTMLAVPIAALTATAVLSQDKGSVDPKPLPPLVNPNDPELGAKELFGRKTSPAPLATHSIGFYDKGCLAGAEALPINGKTWQVMRLSRNRNWEIGGEKGERDGHVDLPNAALLASAKVSHRGHST